MNKPKKVELLAPAGDWNCLKAAVLNGADAVYFGLREFSARKRAQNFYMDELGEVFEYLHMHNVKGYIAFNTLIFPSELSNAMQYFSAIAAAGADAVIVQDLGIAKLIKTLAPTLQVHASTQMTLTDAGSIELAASLGISRAILAREMSLVELKNISSQSPIELESFVHGALCISYSGQCLASLSLAGRSANRGTCAQLCRMPYEVVANGEPMGNTDKKYVLSPRDLAAIKRTGDLAQAGVTAFKIEGRLKNEHYVASSVAAYRACIDAMYEGKAPGADKPQLDKLMQSFSRGFCEGYLDGEKRKELVHGLYPKSRGVLIGTVLEKQKYGIVLETYGLERTNLKAGDGVVIEQKRDGVAEQGGRLYKVQSQGSGEFVIMFGPGDVDFAKIDEGANVWKTDDPAMKKEIELTFAKDRVANPAAINIKVNAAIGDKLKLSFTDDKGNTAQVSWDGPLVKAQKYPLSTELLKEQLGRLGATPFTIGEITAEVLEDVMVPKSVLNDLRRQAVEQLLAMRRENAVHKIAQPEALTQLQAQVKAEASNAQACETTFSILVRTIEQLDCVLELTKANTFKPAMVYCEFKDQRQYCSAVSNARSAGVTIGIATLRVIKPGEEKHLAIIKEAQPDAVLVRNLAALAWCKKNMTGINIVTDFSLNVANELTVSVLRDWGAQLIVPSYDLKIKELDELIKRTSPAWYQVIVHDRLPMFHTEHCVFADMLGIEPNRSGCGKACKNQLHITDCKGVKYLAMSDAGCRNTIYSGQVQSAAMYIGKLKAVGVAQLRINLLEENASTTAALIEFYQQLLAGTVDCAEAYSRISEICGIAHVSAGTLEFKA